MEANNTLVEESNHFLMGFLQCLIYLNQADQQRINSKQPPSNLGLPT